MKYHDAFLKQEILQHPQEEEPRKPRKPVLAVSAGAQVRDGGKFYSLAWLCPHCGCPAAIEDLFRSLDGERTLTMWSCEPCQVVAVTPDAIKEPPTGWVSRIKQ